MRIDWLEIYYLVSKELITDWQDTVEERHREMMKQLERMQRQTPLERLAEFLLEPEGLDFSPKGDRYHCHLHLQFEEVFWRMAEYHADNSEFYWDPDFDPTILQDIDQQAYEIWHCHGDDNWENRYERISFEAFEQLTKGAIGPNSLTS